jgi:hypothetical protein
MDKSELSKLLLGREKDAIIRTLAMMAFNPSIGRVLQEEAVDRFGDLMVETVPKLYSTYASRREFDQLHAEVCEQIIASEKTARGQALSYGQAQKPINVFFKVYVDWAKLPDRSLAEKLAPHLHVPLDSLMMKFFKREFATDYEEHIGKLRQRRIDRTAERLEEMSSPRTLARRLAGNEFSLANIDKETYLAWQDFLRSLWSGKPVLLDLIWVIERSRVRDARGCAARVRADAAKPQRK